MTSMTEPEVLIRVEGVLGHLTLNRPRQLNALNPSMIDDLHGALRDWADDPAVQVVLIDGAGGRGLCAGGDIKIVYSGITGDSMAPLDFWTREYAMNAAVAVFSKPYVAFMDGICMGGGWGISVHGKIRIVTERSVLAMPETAIGFIPDVGTMYWLARMPGAVGEFVALTGARLSAGDALTLGLADFCVPSETLPMVVEGLTKGIIPDASLGVPPPPATITQTDRGWIDSCFIADTVEEIEKRLGRRSEAAAGAALQTLQQMSPTALKVALAALRRARSLNSVAEVLAQDLRLAVALTRHPDLAEGIRAMLVDRDRNPRWSPATLSEVTDDDVRTFFAAHPRIL